MDDDFSPMPPRRGRAAADNPPNRFEPLHVIEDPGALDEDERRQIATTYLRDTPRSILARNDSPDIPFTYSLNPYRGCEHGCAYCLSGETPILMGDGSVQPLHDVQVGDVIYGTVHDDGQRRFIRTRVLAHWATFKPAYRLTLEDETRVIASGDHRFLTPQGWRHVVGDDQRANLRVGDAVVGVGRFERPAPPTHAYRRGYLCGMLRGDSQVGYYEYERNGHASDSEWRLRLVLKDVSALKRTSKYLERHGVGTHDFVFQESTSNVAVLSTIRTHARANAEAIQEMIRWPERPTDEWLRGYLAGIFDAEGSYSDGILRISNADEVALQHLEIACQVFGFTLVHETNDRDLPPEQFQLLGGLGEHLRFIHTTAPAIPRKINFEGQILDPECVRRVVTIEPMGSDLPMYDITTGTGDFIADGVVSHNCYARPTHEYLGFSGGLDFETKIVVKEEAPSLLAETLQKPSWKPEPILMSGGTDPYQPVERQLEITRGCLEVFLRHRHPVMLITKNYLITRDLDLLEELAALNLVRVIVSVTSLSDEIVGAMEPRTSRPPRRLRIIEELSEAGVPVGVNAAPLVPGLTDEELPSILEAAAERGATTAGYIVMRLPGVTRTVFIDWLHEAFPTRADKVLRRLGSLRGEKLNDNRFGKRMWAEGEWADLLQQLYQVTCRRLGLNRERPRLTTEHYRRLTGGQMDLF